MIFSNGFQAGPFPSLDSRTTEADLRRFNKEEGKRLQGQKIEVRQVSKTEMGFSEDQGGTMRVFFQQGFVMKR